ncbi:MAG: hypothetical protein V4565_10505 [Bacteroidota bacterium]
MKNRPTVQFIKTGLTCISLCLIASSCTAPKSITESGKVTPKSQIKAGVNYNANIPTQTIKNAFEITQNGVAAIQNFKSDIEEGENAGATVNSMDLKKGAGNLSKYMIAYSIDPVGYGTSYYARYGLMKKIDIGYQQARGTHAFDMKYQFMGTTGAIGSYSENRMYGSIGVQYSSRQYGIPEKFKMMERIIDYKFKRTDVFVPLIFSKSFGSEEKKGSFSWGVAYNCTFLKYNIHNKIYDELNIESPYPDINEKKIFSSYGTFINLKVGHKCIYFLASLAAYYTDYGTYKLVDGSSAHLKGFTYIPSFGMQLVLPPLRKSMRR